MFSTNLNNFNNIGGPYLSILGPGVFDNNIFIMFFLLPWQPEIRMHGMEIFKQLCKGITYLFRRCLKETVYGG